jgi:WD40 repeat protein
VRLWVRGCCRCVVVAGWDGLVRIFDLRKRLRPLAVLRHHRGGVHAVAFAAAAAAAAASPPPRSAPSASAPGAGAARAALDQGTSAANAPDPWLLASAGADGRIALWRLYPPTGTSRQ